MKPDAAVILAHTGEPARSQLVQEDIVPASPRRAGNRIRVACPSLEEFAVQKRTIRASPIRSHESVAELPGMPPVEEMEVAFRCAWNRRLARGRSSWREQDWAGKRVVAIAPGSLMPHKRWPLEKFIALGRELVRNHHAKIVVIGTSLDKESGKCLAEEVGGDTLNLAGETTLSQSAALLEHCAFLVGNDGGAMHLGSAMRCPVVSIVPGIEYPGSVEPFFSQQLAVRHDVPCAPCYSFTYCPQNHNKCVVDISVHDVYEQCRNIIATGMNNDRKAFC